MPFRPRFGQGSWDAALQESVDACQRTSQIVDDLRLFARKRGSARTPLRLASPVRTAIRFTARANSHANVEIDIDSDVHVVGEETALGQVATNLLDNALHAIEDQGPRGRVRVSVHKVDGQGELLVQDQLAQAFRRT